MNGYRETRPDRLEDEIRWNSGEYKFPAGLFNMPDELGLEWSTELNGLHEQANRDIDSREVYEGLIAIACEAIAELTGRGLLDNWSAIDFNVAEVGDNLEMVKQRDRQIRSLIMRNA